MNLSQPLAALINKAEVFVRNFLKLGLGRREREREGRRGEIGKVERGKKKRRKRGNGE
jgi:hypothetical protein